jgi:hypothetical protein
MTACESELNDLPAKKTGCPGDSNMHRFSNTATKGGPQYSSPAGALASVSVSGGGLELGVSEFEFVEDLLSAATIDASQPADTDTDTDTGH